ncbi:hypothetical protein GCM10022279_09380 [Comamonas faecalis]|uniref:histidine kinase n=1 Tax=Comamonas faecalis TaxID=1387849 RepID=A0ABP7QW14_9BURK
MSEVAEQPDAQAQRALDAARQQITDMQEAQQAFVGAVVHDLRAPLRHVTSFGVLVRELLQELPDPPEQVSEAITYVQIMEQSARRMAAMVDGLQAIARAQVAPLYLAPQPVAAAVRQAVDAVRGDPALAVPGGVQWQLQLAGDLPALHADAALLHQLLVQLLANALKFSRGAASACITVHAAAQESSVRLQIEDNGAGFDPTRAGALWGVFQRLHSEGEFEGVGAGLALCRAIAQRHGAQTAITAQPAKGCSVTLDWPACLGQEPQ